MIARALLAVCGVAALAGSAAAQPVPPRDQGAADPPAKEPPALRADVTGQIFAGYDQRRTEEQRFSEFVLSRGEARLHLTYGEVAGAELAVEAIRSAGQDSLVGVDGDSLVFRAKRAWGYGRFSLGPVVLEGRGGLIPDPWIEAAEDGYDLRGVSATAGERAGFFDTSDLGAAARVAAFGDRLALHVAVTNGEGRNLPEQNAGKNTTAVLALEPVRFSLAGTPAALRLLFGGRDGSRGSAEARAHRLMAAAFLSHRRYSGGVEAERAYGVLDRPDLVQQALGVWASVRFVPWLGAAARYDLVDRDVEVAAATQHTVTLGLYAEPFDSADRGLERFRVYGVAQIDRFGDMAGPFGGVPEASNETRFLLLLSLTATTRATHD